MKKPIILFVIITTLIISILPYKNYAQIKSMSMIEYSYKVKHIQLSDEINIAYADEGEGVETIIFIHGLGSYIPAWKRNIKELSKKYRCIALDLPGYGKSSKNPHNGMMTFYAKVVSEFMDKLNLKSAVIAGHSMGGQIAMVMAISYPQKVKKLILVDPAGFELFNPGQKSWLENIFTPNLVKSTSVEAIETNLAVNFYNMPDEALFMIKDRIDMRSADDFYNYCYTVSKSVSGMIEEPVFDKLSLIIQPTLIMFGEKDNLIPNRYLNPGRTVKIAENGANSIKNSKLVMVPKCGHFMMFEKPEVFNKEVADFLN